MIGKAVTAMVILLLVAAPVLAGETTDDSTGSYQGPSPVAAREALDYSPQLDTPDSTLTELNRILAEDEYREDGVGDIGTDKSWLGKLLNWLQQRTGGSSPAGQPQWTWILSICLAGLLLIYFLTRLVWWLMGWRRDRVGPGDIDPELTKRMSPAGLLKLAVEAADRGDHRSAVRYRYLALLKRLQMPEAPLRTNSQVKRWIARRHPAASVGFCELVACYEDVWYGDLPCGPADFVQAGDRAAGVERQVAADLERQVSEERHCKEGRHGQAE